MQPSSPENGFECKSGCIAPEACINALNIRAIHVASAGLHSAITDKSSVEAIRTLHGDLSSLKARSEHVRAQEAALYDACGLFRLEADGLLTDAVDISDMPPLD